MGRDVPTAAVRRHSLRRWMSTSTWTWPGSTRSSARTRFWTRRCRTEAPRPAGDRAPRRLADGSIDVAEVRRAPDPRGGRIRGRAAAARPRLRRVLPVPRGRTPSCPWAACRTGSTASAAAPREMSSTMCDVASTSASWRRWHPSRVASPSHATSGSDTGRQPDRPISRERAYEINDMAGTCSPTQSALVRLRVPAPPPRHRRHGPRGGQRGPWPDAPDRGGPVWWTNWADAVSPTSCVPWTWPSSPATAPDRHPARPRRLPVRGRDGRIAGFIGRDVSGDPRAPKYRNPAHAGVRQVAHPLPAHLGHASSGGDGGRRRRTTGRPRHRRHRSRRRPDRPRDPGQRQRHRRVRAEQPRCAPSPPGIVLALDGDDADAAPAPSAGSTPSPFNATACKSCRP